MNAKLILVYVSFGSEVNTIELIKYFLKNNKQIAIPKIENKQMNFYYIESLNELAKGKYNIQEPTTNNKVYNYDNCVSITPGICFSHDLYRIGYGGGYYDKFYRKQPQIYKIALTYDECISNTIPNDIYDQKVDEIITPTKNII